MKPAQLSSKQLTLTAAFAAQAAYAQIDLDFSPGVADGQTQQAIHIDNDADTFFSAGDYFYIDNVGFDSLANTYIDARISILDTNSEIMGVEGTNNDSLKILLNSREGSLQNAFVTFNLSFWESDGIVGSLDDSANNAYSIDNITFQAFDIDRSTLQYSDIFGYSDANAPTSTTLAADTLLEQTGFENTETYAVPENYTTYALQKDEEGNYLGEGGVTPNSPMSEQEDFAVNLEYDDFHEGNFIWGITGERSNSAGKRGMWLSGSSDPVVDIVAPATPTPTVYAFTALAAGLYFKNRRNSPTNLRKALQS